MDLIQTTNAALTAVAKVIDYFKSNVGHITDTSLTKITKLTRAEPLTVISNDCANMEALPDILQTLASIYAGYFLQAAGMMCRVNNVEVIRILDRLNPDRDSTGFLLQGRYATENIDTLLKSSYRYSLPTRTLALESSGSDTPMVDSVNQKTIYEMPNLAVGKLINLALAVPDECSKTGERIVNVPITVRLSPALLNEESLTYLFTHRKEDNGLVERYHSWRAGRIEFIRDMIFAEDLIREYRRAAIKDKTGTLQEIVRRANNARAFGLLTKNPSLSIASNIYVLSKDSAQMIEAKVGQRFSSVKGREKILEGTYAMIIAVVDPEWNIVTCYFNGIPQPSTFSLKSLKSSSKGPDIGDIMKTLLEGRAPTF